MKCPKCNNDTNELEGFPFSAAKCVGCNGIWFRDGAHTKAKEIEGIAAIDETNSNAAKAYNELRDVSCPECNQKLIAMVDSTQLHIKYEACPDGCGAFFDSGEFKDLTDYTLTERIKQTYETIKSNLK